MESDAGYVAGDFLNDNFNSRAHVERDIIDERCTQTREISTHALTWSATRRATPKHRKAKHFNSRAHVERDQRSAQLAKGQYDFNSRAHVERDMKIKIAYQKDEISTHALTWSATFRNHHKH